MRDFLERTGGQIRWKRARKPLLAELEAHILDRRDTLVSQGADPNEAEAQAVLEMGDPEEVGLALDRVHRPVPNWLLIGCTAGLLLIGILLLWAVGDRETYLGSMLLYAGLGIGALVGGYFLDYTLLAKCPAWVLFALCSVCVVLPFFGNEYLTSIAQLCYVLPVLFIPLVYRAGSGEKKDATLLVCGGAACVAAAVFSHSWMSLTVYMTVVCLGLVFFAAAKGWLGRWKRRVLLWCIVPPAVIFCLLYIISADSLMSRLMHGVIRPEADPEGYGWVTLRVRELISTSRLFGEGETSELLEAFIAPNDICSVEHLLAVATHKFGLVVFILIVLLASAAGLVIAKGIRRQSSRLGALTILAAGLCFGVRTAAYLVSNLGCNLFYFEGLPMFSYCGKLMVLDMLVMGILLSVFRTGSIARDKQTLPHAPAAG